jgi:hypothetical protein
VYGSSVNVSSNFPVDLCGWNLFYAQRLRNVELNGGNLASVNSTVENDNWGLSSDGTYHTTPELHPWPLETVFETDAVINGMTTSPSISGYGSVYQTVRDRSPPCPKEAGELFTCGTTGHQGCLWDLPETNWVFRGDGRDRGPVQALTAPSSTYVEVTHCNAARESNGRGVWFYLARGSGIFLPLGKTKVFAKHQDAMQKLLGIEKGCYQCDDRYADLVSEMKRVNLTTVQFWNHDDQRCGNTHTEIMAAGIGGGDHFDFHQLKCGLKASCDCRCKYIENNAGHSCLSCEPHCHT